LKTAKSNRFSISDIPSTELALAKRACKTLCEKVVSSLAENVQNIFPETPDLGNELFNIEDQEWTDKETNDVLSSQAAMLPNQLPIAMLSHITQQEFTGQVAESSGKVSCIVCKKNILPSSLLSHYQNVHKEVLEVLNRPEKSGRNPLQGLGWDSYRRKNYAELKGTYQVKKPCPICNKEQFNVLRHLQGKNACVEGKEDEIWWQIVKLSRIHHQLKNGTKKYVICPGCEYPMVYFDKDGSDVFKVHMSPDMCRFLGAKDAKIREEEEKDLKQQYEDGELKVISHPEAKKLIRDPKMLKDKFDLYETCSDWRKAGSPTEVEKNGIRAPIVTDDEDSN
jgi:hypothetical protein